MYISVFDKKRVGHILGDFFKNSTGHPADGGALTEKLTLKHLVSVEKHFKLLSTYIIETGTLSM
jgi:hypothetical protein